MTLRNAIEGLLGPDDNHRPAADSLAAEGHEGLEPELFGAALGHYADTAPIEQADALAPIVTRSGPVPFEASDLPEADVPEGADAYALFDAVDPAAQVAAFAEAAEDDPLVELVDDATDALDDDALDHDALDLDDDLDDELDDDFGRDEPFRAFGEELSEPDADFDGLVDLPSDGPAVAEPAVAEFGLGGLAEDPAPADDPLQVAAEAVETTPFGDLDAGFDDGFDQFDDFDDAAEDPSESLFSVDFHGAETDGADPDDLDFDA